VRAPEYGGDGKQVTDRCDDADDPLVAFPGHWGPNGLTTYTGQQFPQKYRGGFFIAFHGSWNRAPLPQAGYNVVFVPMNDGKPGAYEVFAEGFPGTSEGLPGSARHRPTGVAVAPDGSLYVTDDVGGRIYRIFYRGN
jgi:glucose/arabinose dehydrogenase